MEINVKSTEDTKIRLCVCELWKRPHAKVKSGERKQPEVLVKNEIREDMGLPPIHHFTP